MCHNRVIREDDEKMLSRNNFNEKIRQMDDQRDHFSIRKLAIGTASVLIGITFMGLSNQSVNADVVTDNSQPETTEVVTEKNATQDESNGSVKKDTDIAQNEDVSQSQSDLKVENSQEKQENAKTEKVPVPTKETDDLTAGKQGDQSQNSKTQDSKADEIKDNKQEQQTTDQSKNAVNNKDGNQTETQDLVVENKGVQVPVTKRAIEQSEIESNKFNVSDWDGTLNNTTHEYTLNGYHGTDKENIYIPNTQDFIDAGKISTDDKVYITPNLINTIKSTATSIVIDDQGEKNKVYAKGDWEFSFGFAPNLKSVDLSHLDTSNVTDMEYMFQSDHALESANLSGWDTRNSARLYSPFFDDGNLKSANLSGWQFSDTTDTHYILSFPDDNLQNLEIAGSKNVPQEVLDEYIKIVNKSKSKSINLTDVSFAPGVNVSRFISQVLNDDKANIENLNLSGLDTSSITDMSSMFANMPNLKSINLTGWNTSNVTNMKSMFQNDPKLTTIKGLENWDTSKVTDMSFMFASYIGHEFGNMDATGSLIKLDLTNWDTHNVTNMLCMFNGQSHLTSLGDLSHRGNKWDTGKVTNMASMFYGLSSLPDSEFNLTNWDTSNVGDMSYMFTFMKLQKDLNFVNNWNTSKVTDMSYMFAFDSALQDLDLSHWDVGSVGLKNTGQNYSFADMFTNDISLTSVGDISHWNTKNVHDTRDMFVNTPKLDSIDLSGWNTSNLQIAEGMFEYSGAKHINLDNWNFSPMKRLNYSGLVNDNGPLRGVSNMFKNLDNKTVISMNNVVLPDNNNAFEISDFENGNSVPIIVIANGKDGKALQDLLALNNAKWTDLNGNEVTGRQNTNKVTYVRADDNTKQVGQHGLNFVFTNMNDLHNYLNQVTGENTVKTDIGNLSHDWDAKNDTDNNEVVKTALRLSPDSSYIPYNDPIHAEKDGYTLADLMTSRYELHIVDPTTTKETKIPTRTIIIENPNGTTHTEKQTVEFTRNVTKHIDGTEEDTPWTPTSGNWDQFDVPQINGYDSYVDGTASTTISAEIVNENTANVTVHVTYRSNSVNPDNPNNPEPTPNPNPNPTPDKPITPDNPVSPTPNEPVAPTPEVPTTPNNKQNNNSNSIKPKDEKKAKKSNNHKNGNPRNTSTHPEVVSKRKDVKSKSKGVTNPEIKKVAFKSAQEANKAIKANESSKKKNTLPQTGEKKSSVFLVGLGLIALAGLAFVDRKRRN